MPQSESLAGRRGRGNRAGLTRARIVEAARGLDAGSITVKAVADRLGVDRAAVHHHVSDLDTLRELVALDAFTVNLAPITIPPDADWREACRTLARATYDAVLASGGLGIYVQLNSSNLALLEPVDRTIGILTAAGFDDETAARSLATLSTLTSAMARDRLIAERPGGHPRVPELQHALDKDPAPDFPHLRRLARADLAGYDDTQLWMSVGLVLDGMAARLAPARTGP